MTSSADANRDLEKALSPPKDPLAGKKYFGGVTHEDVIAAMDREILAYVDPSLPQYTREYAMVKARLMGKTDDLLQKNARKIRNLKSQINDFENEIRGLKRGFLAFDQAVDRRRAVFGKYFKSNMSCGRCPSLERTYFDDCYLKPYLRQRYKTYTEDQIDSEAKMLQKEFDDKLKSCIKSLEFKLDRKKAELKRYEA
jgi:hypothetical protein